MKDKLSVNQTKTRPSGSYHLVPRNWPSPKALLQNHFRNSSRLKLPSRPEFNFQQRCNVITYQLTELSPFQISSSARIVTCHVLILQSAQHPAVTFLLTQQPSQANGLFIFLIHLACPVQRNTTRSSRKAGKYCSSVIRSYMKIVGDALQKNNYLIIPS